MAAPTRQIYSWGANSYGQLALGHQQDQLSPQLVAMETLGEQVSSISGGGGHTFFLSESGDCWGCGWNSKGQLGLGPERTETNITTPQPLQRPLESHRIIKAVGGWDFSFFLTDNGELFSCGSNSFGQLGLPNLSQTHTPTKVVHPSSIQDVECGLRHTVIVDVHGDVFTCGTGRKGQLGVMASGGTAPPQLGVVSGDGTAPPQLGVVSGDGTAPPQLGVVSGDGTAPPQRGVVSGDGTAVLKLTSFKQVILPGVRAVRGAAGAYHTAVLTDAGEVVMWGENKHGQLGIGQMGVGQVPTGAPTTLSQATFGGGRIQKLRSGWTHLAAVTESGRVYTWGRADYGQLGTAAEATAMPRAVALPPIAELVCGSEHCLARTADGAVYSWGWNEHGICGTGTEANQLHPHLVAAFQTKEVMMIGSGAGHSFAVTRDR